MSDTDAQQSDVDTPAQEQEQAVVPDEAQNPEQYLNWSSRTRDPKDIQKK